MASGNTLLIVDDDAALRRELAEQLTLHEGFAVREAGTGAEALELLAGAEPFAAVLLDVGLPDLDGREVCRRLRAQGFKAPIVMLTAHAAESDTIEGLGSGANDYV
ncbi:MAG TPA: response regulator, partial [Geminicoccaceae bacterium]